MGSHKASSDAATKGGVFALGNFDGVHHGHQAVIKSTIDRARELGLPPRALTFEPHPRRIFNPGDPPFRLTPAPAKEKLLLALGVRDVIVVPFTLELSRLSAEDFVEKILLGQYGMQHAVAGFDFVFGHGRRGNMQNLRTWLAPHKIDVAEVRPVLDAGGEVFSSSRTRDALQAADLKTAQRILGRRWSISGAVAKGEQRGRKIGVPTANIPLGDYLRPKFGVYAVRARRAGDAETHEGVANIGVRPTVDGKTELLEVHLFDFSGDLYGQVLDVELIDFIRPERAFPDLDALKAQIAKDIEAAKAALRAAA